MTRTEKLELVRNAEGFNYISRPGDGPVRYVFDNKVCLGLADALDYIRNR